ncbi:MAG: TetR family transcriptional regulator [Anaerolineales bacterium]|nr:TetR family transcriptional regulator [Anaerolineales bacterium]
MLKIDPRVLRTQKLIEDAFLELLNEKTLQTVTVGEITTRAMINRATFYDHFVDKYALFDHIVRKTFQETIRQHGLEPTCPFSQENLGRLIEATGNYFVYLNSQCPPAERQFRPIAEGQIQVILYEYLQNWVKEEPQDNLQASFLSWSIFGTFLQQIGNGQAPDVTAITNTIQELAAKVLYSES